MNNKPIQPLVSVLIPTYNAGAYLRPAVESIVNQTYQALAIIVIDDGSTDNSINSIEDIQDHRLQILRKENGGKASALNLALGVIKGQFWMIQDADDMSYPERVEKQINALQDNPDLAAVFVGTDLIFKGKKFAPVYPRKSQEDCKNEVVALKLPAHDATGMYRASITKNLFFDNELKIGQGVDFVWQVGEVFPITVLEECLYSHRVNYQSITHERPNDNYEKINIVIKKACQRRGWDFNKYKRDRPPVLLKKKRGMDSILPYAIESVITLKRRKSYFDAVKTAFICISINPLDYMFYKPMLYLFIPQSALAYYRNRENRR